MSDLSAFIITTISLIIILSFVTWLTTKNYKGINANFDILRKANKHRFKKSIDSIEKINE